MKQVVFVYLGLCVYIYVHIHTFYIYTHTYISTYIWKERAKRNAWKGWRKEREGQCDVIIL